MWLFSLQKVQHAKPVRRPVSHRPRLEMLEDRCVPSTSPLDPTFGSGGIVTTQIGTSSDALAVALHSDGRIVVAGTSITRSGWTNPRHFTLARYTTSGSLDATFGSGGEV